MCSYQVLLIGKEQREMYNRFVHTSVRPHFLQTYEWGELKSGTGWQPLRLMLTRDDTPIAAISLLKRKLPLVGGSVFYAPRGPVIGKGCDSKDEEYFWQEVKKLGKKEGAILIKIDPDITVQDKEAKARLEVLGFRPADAVGGFGGIQPRYVFRLDITKSEDELLAGMASKTRYNLRLAIRKGVKVRIGENKNDLRVFYDILQETAERDRFLIRDYSYFEKMWDLFIAQDTARLFLAEYQGKVIAGTIAFHCGDRVWYLYGASSNQHRNVMPNYLLQWEMIRWGKSLNCTLYDMRGVPPNDDPDNPLAGLYRFKKGFGAEFTEFIGDYDLPFSTMRYFLWQWGMAAYEKYLNYVKHRKMGQEEN